VVARRVALIVALRTRYRRTHGDAAATRGVAARAWVEPPQPLAATPASTRSAETDLTPTPRVCASDLRRT
jgi:hypothetical protein